MRFLPTPCSQLPISLYLASLTTAISLFMDFLWFTWLFSIFPCMCFAHCLVEELTNRAFSPTRNLPPARFSYCESKQFHLILIRITFYEVFVFCRVLFDGGKEDRHGGNAHERTIRLAVSISSFDFIQDIIYLNF